MRRGPKKNICILLPLEMYYQVQEQAEKRNRSMASYVRQVLRRYLWYEENEPEKLTGEWEIR